MELRSRVKLVRLARGTSRISKFRVSLAPVSELIASDPTSASAGPSQSKSANVSNETEPLSSWGLLPCHGLAWDGTDYHRRLGLTIRLPNSILTCFLYGICFRLAESSVLPLDLVDPLIGRFGYDWFSVPRRATSEMPIILESAPPSSSGSVTFSMKPGNFTSTGVDSSVSEVSRGKSNHRSDSMSTLPPLLLLLESFLIQVYIHLQSELVPESCGFRSRRAFQGENSVEAV